MTVIYNTTKSFMTRSTTELQDALSTQRTSLCNKKLLNKLYLLLHQTTHRLKAIFVDDVQKFIQL